MPFKIVRNDITKMQVDAIVNTANEAPIYSRGTDSAVYQAAGAEELLEARQKIGYLSEGEVAITPGFQLPAKYIIHAVSPYYNDGQSGEEEKLRSCYKKSLELALEKKCQSIAFPLISTGGFGYPKEEGIRIAIDEINAFLLKHKMLVYLVVFDEYSTRLGLNLFPDLKSYINHNYVCKKCEKEYKGAVLDGELEQLEDMLVDLNCLKSDNAYYEEIWEENDAALQERMKHLKDTFQEYLFYLIGEKGFKNSEVYNRAFLTKQLFSKIKLNLDYHGSIVKKCYKPSK